MKSLLTIVHQHPTENRRLTLNVLLRQGLTLPRLRDLCPTGPVLLATERADQEALGLVAAHPFVTFWSMPFRLEEFRGHLHQVAGGQPLLGPAVRLTQDPPC